MNLTSLEPSNFIGIIIPIILIYVAKFYYKYFTRPNPLPGPFPLPFIGNLFQLIYYAKGNKAALNKMLHEKHGDIYEMYIGDLRRIVLARADYVEKLMSPSKKNNYILKLENDIFVVASKRGILFNNDIPSWRFNRQFLTQAILTPSFSKEVLYRTPILFKELNGYWKEIGDEEPIDFAIWIHKFTTEIIFQLIVGLKINALVKYFNDNVESSMKIHVKKNPIDEEIENFAELVENELSYFAFTLTYPAFIRHTILKKRNKEMHEKKDKTIKLTMKVINYRRNEIEQTPVHEELRHDMLTSLITANTERDINKYQYNDEEHAKPLTNDQINQILLESISGGIDTTANLLCYIVYYLCHYPDVLARLRQELDSIFGSDQNRQITMEDLSKMHYTEAIIKECARLVNTVKFTQRVSTTSDTVAGYKWPADTTFVVYLEGIHHNPIYWKDYHKFNPDRFMEADPQKNTFLMFGGGSRICPGRKLALVEIKCLITLIYRNLDITLVDMNAPLKLNFNFFTKHKITKSFFFYEIFNSKLFVR